MKADEIIEKIKKAGVPHQDVLSWDYILNNNNKSFQVVYILTYNSCESVMEVYSKNKEILNEAHQFLVEIEKEFCLDAIFFEPDETNVALLENKHQLTTLLNIKEESDNYIIQSLSGGACFIVS